MGPSYGLVRGTFYTGSCNGSITVGVPYIITGLYNNLSSKQAGNVAQASSIEGVPLQNLSTAPLQMQNLPFNNAIPDLLHACVLSGPLHVL